MSQQIRQKCNEVFAKASHLYSLDFSQVQIRFDLKGRTAGMAGWRGHGVFRTYFLRFNVEMLTRVAEKEMDDTVSHEIAHTVCHMKPELGGHRHNHVWQRVHRSLGGSASRTHDNEVVYAKGLTFEYTTNMGFKVRISETKHKRLQGGWFSSIRWRAKGHIDKKSTYVIVGQQGRTLSTPVVPKVSPAPLQRMLIPPVADPNFAEKLRRFQASAPVVRSTGTALSDAERMRLGWGPKVPSYSPATTPAPVANEPLVPAANESKAAVSRRIMRQCHVSAMSQEEAIGMMMRICGYNRQLARATYNANAERVGLPKLS